MRQGILGRDTVQLRLQRITEVNIRQALIERVLGTGSLIIDVQGEDDSLTLEYMRKPAVVQRVLNSQINEIVGGGRREAIPAEMRPRTGTVPPTPTRTPTSMGATTTTTTRTPRPLRRRCERPGPGAGPERRHPRHAGRPRHAGDRPLRDTGPAH